MFAIASSGVKLKRGMLSPSTTSTRCYSLHNVTAVSGGGATKPESPLERVQHTTRALAKRTACLSKSDDDARERQRKPRNENATYDARERRSETRNASATHKHQAQVQQRVSATTRERNKTQG
jgi:hypothetical protein